MADELNYFSDEDIYKFKRVGAFGRFTANSSFPVDYVLTSMTPAEITQSLSFARDIDTEKWDFDLLMQRDIDEERVKDKITPYLESETGTNAQKISFFPPLLAAVIPLKAKMMQTFYADEEVKIEGESQLHLVREWPAQFRVIHVINEGHSSYELEIPAGAEERVVHRIAPAQARIELNLSGGQGQEQGVALVVIDGQHRLAAIKDLYESHADKLRQLVVPVCIMFAPESTALNNGHSAEELVPKIPTVFRKLFVDVNNTAEQVGGHFTVLLSDTNASSLVCRAFCSWVLDNKGPEALAMVEWNQKSKRASRNLNENHSITSVGILDHAMTELLKENKTKFPLFKYLFAVEARQDLIKSDSGDEDDEESKIPTSDSFTLRQRTILSEIAYQKIAPLLYKLFFESRGFREAAEAFLNEIGEAKKEVDDKKKNFLRSKVALEYFLKYKPNDDDQANLRIEAIKTNVHERRQEQAPAIIRYAIFQRGMMRFWGKLLELGRKQSLAPEAATDATVAVLDAALANKGANFAIGAKTPYVLHTLYKTPQTINTAAKNIENVCNLLYAHAANDEVANAIAGIFKIDREEREEFLHRLQSSALTAAKRFLDDYKANRTKDFVSSFATDPRLSAEEIEQLRNHQDELAHQRMQVRQGQMKGEDVTKEFDQLVDTHVSEDVEEARGALAKALKCKVETIAFTDEEAEEIEAE